MKRWEAPIHRRRRRGGPGRDQVGDIDKHLQWGWRQGKDYTEKYLGTELRSDSGSRSILISQSDYDGSSSDSPSRSSSSSCPLTCM